MSSSSLRIAALNVAAVLTIVWGSAFASATFSQETPTGEINEAASQFSDPEEFIWEFGMRLSCHGGQADGIVATVPVPIQWTEQNIELLDEVRTDNVGKITIKKLTREAKMMVFKVRRLGDGESAEAFLRFKILKSNILPPEDKSLLKIASPVPGKARAFLKPSPFIESKDKKIRAIAAELKAANASKSDWAKVEAIYTWVRDNVKYEFDTQIHTCLEAIESGHGDCEELSSLFIAICRAQGIPARAVWVPGHTYPEFYLVDGEGKGHWFPCQAAGAQHEFGEMDELRPIIQKGDRFKLPGDRNFKRYVQPTAFAADASGSIQVDEWIMREQGGQSDPTRTEAQ